MTTLASLRPATGADANFVLSSWLKSFFRNRQMWVPLPLAEHEYFHGHHRLLEKLLQRASVVVACDQQDPSQILGWLCYEMIREPKEILVVHFVYVKSAYRGFGVGRQLWNAVHVPDIRTVATHWTKRLKEDKAELRYNLEYNPYLAMTCSTEAA